MKIALFSVLFAVVFSGLALAQTGQTGFPHKDGGFSAMLFVIPEESLKEFAKPSDQGPVLRQLSKVKRGEKFVAKIGFTGFALNKERKADVKFDFKITTPDGKVMGDYKDLVANNLKIENTSYVFDNLTELVIAFDETDKPGIYKLQAEIRDNIGKKKIPLEDTIELVE